MLTEEQWRAVEPLVPESTARTGRPMADRRTLVEAMLFQLVTGCQWRRLPRGRFGPWQTVYHHFNRWRAAGVFARLADALRRRADRDGRVDWSLLSIDGTSVRAAACAAGYHPGRGSPRPPSRPTTRSAAAVVGSAPSSTSPRAATRSRSPRP